MRVNGEEADAGGVDAGNDEVRADVALVAEEVLFQHRHAGDDAGLAAGGESVQFEVGGDDGGGEFSVGGGAGAGAPYLGRDVVELFAVLWVLESVGFERIEGRLRSYFICDYRAARCSCVGRYYNSSIKYASDDCGTGACSFGKGYALRMQCGIAVVVGEVKPGHAGDG